MDKENQHHNELGDGLNNLSPEYKLPSIWDNISQELNTIEEMDSSANMEDAADVDGSDAADFSVIKEGFELNFQSHQPPKFMWDHIEQELEAFTITDDVAAFSAIKAGFEQTYKESSAAPNFTWNDLSEEMDNPSPKAKEEDYSFVKSGFEKQYSAIVLPLFDWSDLAERMDNEAALADTPDKYSIIKDSFAKEYQGKVAAPTLWNNIQTQLDLLTVWGRFLYNIKSQTAAYWARNAMLLGAVCLLIGGGRSCIFDHPMANAPTAQSIAYNTSKNTDNEADTPIHSNKKRITKGEELERAKAFENKKNKQRNASNKQGAASNPSTVNIAPVDANFAINNKNKLAKKAAAAANHENKTGLNAEGIASKEGTATTDVAAEMVYDGNEVRSNNSGSNKLHSKTSNATNLQENGTWFGNQSLVEQNFAINNNSEAFLNMLTKKVLEDPAIAAMEENNFTIVRQRLKSRKLRFEIGLIGRAGTSMLLSKSTYKALESSSFSSTQLRLTGSVGAIANCFVSPSDAIVLAVYPYSTAQQQFSGFTEQGYYTNKEIQLNYVDFTIGYQRTLFRYNSLGNAPSKLYARLDFGFGYLTQATELVNRETTLDVLESYNKFNFSLGLSLGNSHQIKQFVFDYGITGNVGMNNIMTPLATTESVNLLNFGAYVGVRYALFAKLRTKTKQFEWSPPFYIDEF